MQQYMLINLLSLALHKALINYANSNKNSNFSNTIAIVETLNEEIEIILLTGCHNERKNLTLELLKQLEFYCNKLDIEENAKLTAEIKKQILEINDTFYVPNSKFEVEIKLNINTVVNIQQLAILLISLITQTEMDHSKKHRFNLPNIIF